MEMCYEGALAMPSGFAVMEEEEMMIIEGGGAFTAKTALKWIAATILGGIVYDVLKAAAIKVGCWAALNAAAIATVVSRVVAVGILTGIAACYGAMLYKTYKSLMKKR
ncbi:hypothetical protein C8E03_10818 [Lachnotalea glycerini]|uniref:Uncharacterized protein n=1 Tax=Lachnotalea glycerini TaxID=1763509 RepID=A0A255INB1_9FIRM|nr:hypothetical protein [Lachnotalea glycerini]OYP35356.1 hypothetical protein CG709_06150 [Lachnotalea glycerini]PXV88297.1 hypothetical protein C8E03_10818 [Lachnotalea glycerini]RDY30877.1 hypothetical protein CG710_012455 [Lachnotalea glycerini]